MSSVTVTVVKRLRGIFLLSKICSMTTKIRFSVSLGVLPKTSYVMLWVGYFFCGPVVQSGGVKPCTVSLISYIRF